MKPKETYRIYEYADYCLSFCLSERYDKPRMRQVVVIDSGIGLGYVSSVVPTLNSSKLL